MPSAFVWDERAEHTSATRELGIYDLRTQRQWIWSCTFGYTSRAEL